MVLQVLLIVLVALVVLGGRKHLSALLGAAKHTPADFKKAKSRAADPVPHARDITPPSPDDVTPDDTR